MQHFSEEDASRLGCRWHRGGTEGSGHTAWVNPLLLVSSMTVGRGLDFPEAVSSLITQNKY